MTSTTRYQLKDITTIELFDEVRLRLVEQLNGIIDSIGIPVSEMTIAQLDLSIRASNCLTSRGINTVGDLMKTTKRDVSLINSMGVRTLKEVERKLHSLGVDFRKDYE